MRVTDSLKLLLGADEEELAAVLRQHREAVRAFTVTGPRPGTPFRERSISAGLAYNLAEHDCGSAESKQTW